MGNSSAPMSRHQLVAGGITPLRGVRPLDIISTLPEDVTYLVLAHLEFEDLKAIRLVCRAWAAIGYSEPVWRLRCSLLWRSLQVKPDIFPTWKETYKGIRVCAGLARKIGIPPMLEHFATYNMLNPDDPDQVAGLLYECRIVDKKHVGYYLTSNPEVMERFFKLQRFENKFLPEAMRSMFSKATFTCVSSLSIAPIIRLFVEQYIECNPDFATDKNHVCILCYSVILLGVDLSNPHVKTKITKREYVKNHRGILPFDQDYYIRIYDDVYLHGHVVEPKRERNLKDALRTIASWC